MYNKTFYFIGSGSYTAEEIVKGFNHCHPYSFSAMAIENGETPEKAIKHLVNRALDSLFNTGNLNNFESQALAWLVCKTTDKRGLFTHDELCELSISEYLS